jgi:DNA-binding transcriptional ArsR family regulator
VLNVFEVVAEPSRRRILDLLCTDARSVGELVDALGMNQPAVSKHLRVLKAAHMVDVEIDAQRRVYRLRAEPLLELETWLAPYRRFWSDRLDLLGRHLDRMPNPPSRPKRRRKRS